MSIENKKKLKTLIFMILLFLASISGFISIQPKVKAAASVTGMSIGVSTCQLNITGLDAADVIYCKWDTINPPGANTWVYLDETDISQERADDTNRKYLLRGLDEETTYYYELYVDDVFTDSGSFTTHSLYGNSVKDTFVDDYLIESMTGTLSLTVSTPEVDCGRLLNDIQGYVSVYYKNGWHLLVHDNRQCDDNECLEYYTSDDGLTWNYQHKTCGDLKASQGRLIFDPEDDKYKFFYLPASQANWKAYYAEGDTIGTLAAVGGIYDEIHAGDELFCVIKDSLGGAEYVGWTNQHDPLPESHHTGYIMGFSEQDQYIIDERLDSLEGLETETHGVVVTIRDGVYIGFCPRLDDPDDGGDDHIDTYLVASRDGVVWTDVDNTTPILPRGVDGTWRDEIIYPGMTPFINIGDYEYCYYNAYDRGHDWTGANLCSEVVGMGLYKFRKDGFSHVTGLGNLTTKTYNFNPTSLKINANCSATENITIAILNDNGVEVAGYGMDDFDTITTNSTSITPTWGGNTVNNVQLSSFKLKFWLQGSGSPEFYSYNVSGLDSGSGSNNLNFTDICGLGNNSDVSNFSSIFGNCTAPSIDDIDNSSAGSILNVSSYQVRVGNSSTFDTDFINDTGLNQYFTLASSVYYYGTHYYQYRVRVRVRSPD